MSVGMRLASLPRPVVRRLIPLLRYLYLMRALEWRHLAPWVRQVEDWQVLDVGCGHGLYSLELACRGAILVGCDLQEEGLIVARQVAQRLGLGGRTTYSLADGTDLPWPDEQFDLVVCNCVLEHIADDQAALRSMARVLRPGGLLYLTVDSAEHGRTLDYLEWLPRRVRAHILNPRLVAGPGLSASLDTWLDELYGILHRYRRDDLATRLDALGLTLVDSHSYLGGVGAAQFELLHVWRGIDPDRGIGRWLHIASSLLLYPLAVLSDQRTQKKGRGLAVVARRKGTGS